MKDNLPNIWHKHDGRGMPIYLDKEDFEVQFRDGTTAKNHRNNWSWAYYPSSEERGSNADVIGWRYIVPETFERKEEIGKVIEIAMDIAAKQNELGNRLTKYQRLIRGKDQNGNIASIAVDVYDVLTAWEVQNPALQHLIKKALQPGARGHKSLVDDLKDIIASAQRALELAKGDVK